MTGVLSLAVSGYREVCAICGDPTHNTRLHEETLDADF